MEHKTYSDHDTILNAETTQAYPSRIQLEAGLELAEALGSTQATKMRYMLAMHDEIDFWENAYKKVLARINET